MIPEFSSASLNELAETSDGFSFAQLREAYIMAGPLAFETKHEIRPQDVLAGIVSLRQTTRVVTKRANAAGFRELPAMDLAE